MASILGWYSGPHIAHPVNTRIYPYNRYQHVFMPICKSPKHVQTGGYPGPPLERVFNKTGHLAESLYARARVGVVDQG